MASRIMLISRTSAHPMFAFGGIFVFSYFWIEQCWYLKSQQILPIVDLLVIFFAVTNINVFKFIECIYQYLSSISHLWTLSPGLVWCDHNIGGDKKSPVFCRWNHIVRLVPHLDDENMYIKIIRMCGEIAQAELHQIYFHKFHEKNYNKLDIVFLVFSLGLLTPTHPQFRTKS